MTQLLYRKSQTWRSEINIQKEDIPKNNEVTQYFEANIQRDKTHKQKDNTYDNHTTKNIESSSSYNKNILIKNNNLKYTDIIRTHIIILITNIMNQVQVTTIMILMRNLYINM